MTRDPGAGRSASYKNIKDVIGFRLRSRAPEVMRLRVRESSGCKTKMGWRNDRDRFCGNRLGDQERSGAAENALRDGLQARLGHQFAKPPGGGMVHVALDAGDADVIDEPTP